MSEQSFNTTPENEISLRDIIDFLADSWKTILLGSVVGGLLGLGYAVKAPAKYQATANIQLAKVAGIEVEAPAVVIEKLKMPMFYSQKTYAACGVMESLVPGEVIINSLKPTLAKNTPIITVSYLAASPEDAKKCLESVLDDVRVNQSFLVKPNYDLKTSQLLQVKQKLEKAENILKLLPNKNTALDYSNLSFNASALLITTTLNKESEIKELIAEIKVLEILLAEPQTKEAFLTTPIYAPHQKASPNRTKIVLVGLMAGLFVGLLLMMGKRAYSAYKLPI